MSGNNVRGAMPTLRRNGKPPSCEPCRKSKYCCDHTTPVCKRCERRGIASRCLYHPAPMKGLTPRAQKNGTAGRLRPALAPETAGDKTASPKPHGIAASTPSPRVAIALQPGFIGSTGYNAVLAESGLDSHPDTDIESTVIPSTAGSQPRRFTEALAALELLVDFPQIQKIVNRWNTVGYVTLIVGFLAQPVTAAIGRQIYEGGVLGSVDSLRKTIEKLFNNTNRPVRITRSCRFDAYYKNYIGDNLRWEALCVLFTTCGLGCSAMTCDDPLFDFIGHRDEDRQDFMYKLMQASNTCISFCEEAGQLSDLAVWTLCDNSIYNSQVLGDAHYLTWRKVGDVSTAIFARGYHDQSKDAERLPFWMVDMRRRALGHAYSTDKVLCTFVGRPPRISQRYCSIELPVDLEFEELVLEGAELQAALSNIDHNGWNVNFKHRRTCYQRVGILCAMLREEVLELSLGPLREGMLEKAMDIIARNESLLQSLPDHMRFNPESDNVWDMNITWAAGEYLDLLYNEFMLRRTLVRQLRHDSSKLLELAHRILSIMTQVCGFRSLRGATQACSIGWMAVLYGLPVSGVLALDLLQQKTRMVPTTVSVPRHKLVQDLSVFIASLKWVHAPCEGNYQLVEQARKTLQQILDRVLSDPLHLSRQDRLVAALPSPEDGDDMTGQGHSHSHSHNRADADINPNTNPNIDPDTDIDQLDFSWLDNANFGADFWMNLPDHPLFP